MTPALDGVTDRVPDRRTLLVSLLAGVAAVLGSYAVAGFTPAFVAGPIAGLLARRLPGVVITYGILVLGDLGEQLNVLTAVGLSVGGFWATGLAGTLAARRVGYRFAGPAAGTVLTALVAYVVTGAVAASAGAGVASGVVLATGLLPDASAGTVSSDRRDLLGGVASGVAILGGGLVTGVLATGGADDGVRDDLGLDPSTREETEELLAEAETKSLDVGGLEPLVSDEFFEVDINATDPQVEADSWALTVTGAVEEERTYTYEDVTERPAENRFATLRCVGEDLNGKKLDNALWTGIPIVDVVDPAAPSDECCVMLRAADGYFEEFPLSALQDGFLAYGMNGDPLPRSHGYPVRALIPGHWGEINVKWITEIEVLEEEQDGYWEQRGWHGTGPANTIAKLHLVEDQDDGSVRIGGHAYAGTRGIDRVEVSTDGGETWTDAELSEPLPGDDVWRQWVHTYDPDERPHEVVVRAVDGEGTVQPEAETSPFPSGPTGWVSQTVE